ncbi:hypothetical protein SAMN05428974_2446 [Sphingopyxis sp. YR583]|uniref:hypothetical protein n=1 Tax=Sphingopyxis sp. YR583 TaxID=1881047 RepID=UPI0008A76253|nr:hypothetical protein [Sphingopyxis sp. YR583]SEH18222.1 hypothetical protein SAMN05428974_2446 [Sphingopyxis sp. YR583]
MDATQWAGVISFGLASLICLVTACRPWPLLFMANGCFAAECALGLRHGLHNAVAAAMGEYYSGRGLVQILLILLALGLGIVSLLRQRTDKAGRPRNAAAATTLLSALLFVLETISLHDIDAVLYRPVGGLLVIGWLWLMLGAVTLAGALIEARKVGLKRR